MTWIDRFPELQRLQDGGAEVLLSQARLMRFPAGTELFSPGHPAQNLLLVLSGTVRVQQRSDTGREVVLYRVNAGESCVLTTACLLAGEDYTAEAVAETEIEAAAIPRAVIDDLLARSAAFRSFVFRSYSRRIAELFVLIDDMVFHRIDVRLAARLLELAQGGTVAATHQALSAELGTAREVISRVLGDFQRRGWIEQARGEVRLANREALERLARSVI
jgi:CRP/FNR family transcriptional regulator